MLEQVLDENSPRWITGVKLTRLTMGDKVQHARPSTTGLHDLLLVILIAILWSACMLSVHWLEQQSRL